MQTSSQGRDSTKTKVKPQSLVYDGVDFPELLSKKVGELAFQLASEWQDEQQELLENKKLEVDRLNARIAGLTGKRPGSSCSDRSTAARSPEPMQTLSIDKSVELLGSQSGLFSPEDGTTLPGQPGWEAGASSDIPFVDSQLTEFVKVRPCGDSEEGRDNPFEVLRVWKKMAESPSGNGTGSKPVGQFSPDLALVPLITNETEDKKGGSCYNRLLIEPYSPRRTIWDTMAMALVLYDIIRIPLELLNPPQIAFSIFMGWIVRLYWTFDIPITLVTGYIRNDGRTEVSFRRIARRYLYTWAIFDVLLVSTDWMEVIVKEVVAEEMEIARVGKTARFNRIFRAMRLVRLIRIFRISESFRQVAATLVSEQFIVIFDILMLCVLLLGLAHIIGCMWYGFGNWESHYGDSRWLLASGVADDSLEYQYFVSLHWAVSQFSGGMDEFRPQNLMERIFATFSLLLGFIVLSVCVSGLTSAMTRLLLISSGPSRQLAKVRQYLFEHRISSELTVRVVRNARFILKQQQRCMTEDGIELIAQMSEPLRMELHFELRAPQMTLHFFFNRYKQKCPYGMRSICHNACSVKSLSAGDLIFSCGECPAQPAMLFVASGKLRYVAEGGKVTTVEPGQWVSEGVLWTLWSHVGTLSAMTECELLVLDSLRFQDIVSRFRLISFDPAEYARQYVDRLNQTNYEEISDLEPEQDRRHLFRSSAAGKADDQAHVALALFRSMSIIKRGSGSQGPSAKPVSSFSGVAPESKRASGAEVRISS